MEYDLGSRDLQLWLKARHTSRREWDSSQVPALLDWEAFED